MAITYVSQNTNTQAYTGSALSITKPSGTVDGDLLIAVIGGTRSGGTPSGWTQLGTTTCGSSTGTVYVYFKIANSEGSSYSFPTGTQLALGVVLCYRSTDTTTPVDTTDFSLQTGGTGTNYNTASVTADGFQQAMSFCMPYRSAGTNATITSGSGTQRGSTFGVTAGGSENTSLAIFDSNGVVAAGSTSISQTTTSAAAGAKGILLIKDGGTAAPGGQAAGTATAYGPTLSMSMATAAGQAAGTGTAYGAPPEIGWAAPAGLASATATAYGCTCTLTSSPGAGQAAGAATAYGPTLSNTQASAAGSAAGVAVAPNAKSFLGTPPYRTVYLERELRTITVEAESRTAAVEVENRVIAIGWDEP